MWRRLRIAVLLLILLFVALNTYFDRVYSTDWNIPLRVAVYPINADGSAVTRALHPAAVAPTRFPRIETFFEQEAKQYGLQMERPIRLTLAPPLSQSPPALEPDAGMTVRCAVEPADALSGRGEWTRRPGRRRTSSCSCCITILRSRPRSRIPSACRKDCSAVVHVFADAAHEGSNDTVIAHELLHTLGATDKYDLRTNQPAASRRLRRARPRAAVSAVVRRADGRPHSGLEHGVDDARVAAAGDRRREDRERDRLEQAMSALPKVARPAASRARS